MKSLARIALILAVFIIPVFASAATPYNATFNNPFFSGSGGGYGTGSCATTGIGCVAATVLDIINTILVPLIFAIAFLVFLYGVAKTYIFSHGEPAEVEEGHKLILWGLIGFAVMVSIWGLVNVVANTFGLMDIPVPNLPKSYN